MERIRAANVAGMFYPGDPKTLQETLQKLLSQVSEKHPMPKAMIAPHAGYIYSGPIAASAYACLKKAKDKIKQVVILAPAHRFPFSGIAVTEDDYFETPLGLIPVEKTTISKLSVLPQIHLLAEAFNDEHAIEVHLPFLQYLLDDFTLVPLLVGQTNVEDVTEVIRQLSKDQETLIVISSDLSHYYPYDVAQQLDQQTADAILALEPEKIGVDQACGRLGILALLTIASEKNWQPALIDLRNSGDTSEFRDQVVGYGAFHFY